MCGASGAGKTTTARILCKYERELIAEDLLVVAPEEKGARIFKQGEQILNEWSASSARLFESNRDAVADTSFLSTAGSGPTVDLRSIWFMDASRRIEGDTLEKISLPASEVLVRMLENSFVGTTAWRHHFEMNRRLVASADSYEIKVPNTLDRLEQAIARQTTNSAS
jgi:ABC-type oligopeptide transport system ATPase subunit